MNNILQIWQWPVWFIKTAFRTSNGFKNQIFRKLAHVYTIEAATQELGGGGGENYCLKKGKKR